VIVFCRKDDFPSLFRGNLANLVRVFINKVEPRQNNLSTIRMENRIKEDYSQFILRTIIENMTDINKDTYNIPELPSPFEVMMYNLDVVIAVGYRVNN
jgi:hypothetical protein